MTTDDFSCQPAATGTWLYDGSVPHRVEILACNYDRIHAGYLEEMEHVLQDHGYEMDLPGPPRPLGPDGVLYHVWSSPDFDTIAEAKAWAETQPCGPITWDEP
jgi:hypothetical protein